MHLARRAGDRRSKTNHCQSITIYIWLLVQMQINIFPCCQVVQCYLYLFIKDWWALISNFPSRQCYTIIWRNAQAVYYTLPFLFLHFYIINTLSLQFPCWASVVINEKVMMNQGLAALIMKLFLPKVLRGIGYGSKNSCVSYIYVPYSVLHHPPPHVGNFHHTMHHWTIKASLKHTFKVHHGLICGTYNPIKTFKFKKAILDIALWAKGPIIIYD